MRKILYTKTDYGDIPSDDGTLEPTIPPTPTAPSATQATQTANQQVIQQVTQALIPPHPARSPMIMQGGMITPPWNMWFELIRRRVGGFTSNPMGEDAAILDAFSEPPVDFKSLIQQFMVLVDQEGINQEDIYIRLGNLSKEIEQKSDQGHSHNQFTGRTKVDAIQFNAYLASVMAYQNGLTCWDDQNKTIATVLDATNSVVLQHGNEMYVRCVNKTGVQINDGQVVYISGAQGNRPKCALARADALTTSRVIGVATQNIADNAQGFVTVIGTVNGYNTSGFTEGDMLYLSATTAGALTNVAPVDPNYTVVVATALNSTNNGSIQVHPHCPLANATPYTSPSELIAPSQKAINDYCVSLATAQTITGAKKFGDATNYSTFESDGTLLFAGNATVWKDIDFPIIIRSTGVGIPTLEVLNGNLRAPQWQVNDFNQCECQEFIHEWKEGSTVYWHLHLTTNGLDATDRYVRFSVEYGYVDVNGVWQFPAVLDSGDLLIPANTTSKTMMIMSLGNFTPAVKIGGHSIAYLTRIASTGAAPTNNPWIPMLQLHIQCDTAGSRQISTK